MFRALSVLLAVFLVTSFAEAGVYKCYYGFDSGNAYMYKWQNDSRSSALKNCPGQLNINRAETAQSVCSLGKSARAYFKWKVTTDNHTIIGSGEFDPIPCPGYKPPTEPPITIHPSPSKCGPYMVYTQKDGCKCRPGFVSDGGDSCVKQTR